jgi:6-phosphogluconolactonase
MNFSRRRLGTLAAALTLAGFTTLSNAHAHDDDGFLSGMVFTSSNDAAGNALLVFARNVDGSLALHSSVATGDVGSGAGLGSQGAVALSGDGRWVFVVNAGGNSVSTFALRKQGLQLIKTSPSGGLHPISVTEKDGVVYVLNDRGSGNVAGFRNAHGDLQPIAGSVRGLSAAGGTAPAQVGFSDDGDALVVTEKNANVVTTYRVADDGRIGAPTSFASPGQVPFGFAFNRRNRLVVTEAAASTVSSYRFLASDPARPLVASASVPDTQGAACWISITPNGRFGFVSNTSAATISSYRIAGNGQIELAAAVAGSTGAGSAPADSAISADGRHLYVRSGRTLTISAFGIDHDGTLSAPALANGLPATAVGLAAN